MDTKYWRSETEPASIDPYLLSVPGSDDHEQFGDPSILASLDIAEPQDTYSINPGDRVLALQHDIHMSLLALKQLHQEIYDGIELALDQVQDKRIEWLEMGPIVTVGDVFFEALVVFLLVSPLAGLAVKQAFRFTGNMSLAINAASRKLIQDRLTKRAARALPEYRSVTREWHRLQRNLVLLMEKRRFTTDRAKLQQLEHTEKRLRSQISELSRKEKRLYDTAYGIPDSTQKRLEATEENIRNFFGHEEIAEEYGVPFLRASRSASKAPITSSDRGHEQAAVDSIGVQIKASAQSNLRWIEYYLDSISANVSYLASYSLQSPFHALLALEELTHITSILELNTAQIKEDVKRSVSLEFEKLLWAILLADRWSPKSPENLVGDPETNPGLVLEAYKWLKNQPPKHVRIYLQARFFSDKQTVEIWEELRKLKCSFDKGDKYKNAIQVLDELSFKKKSDPKKGAQLATNE